MKFTESEIVEFKSSTSELKEAIVSLSAMLNKHRWLRKLKNERKIIFKGSAKTGGYWEMVRE